jgi:hypothetical protein
MCLVNIFSPLIVTHVIASQQKVIFDPQDKGFKSVDFKPEVDSAFVEEYHLIDLIQLVKNDDIGVLMPGLQRRQHLEHEVSIVEVGPVEEGGLMPRIRVWDSKCLPVRVQKVFKQKFCVNEFLHPWRQLVINIEICVVPEGCKPIIKPLVLKEVLNPHL